MGILLFAWFAWWPQEVRVICQDQNVSIGVAMRLVISRNKGRCLLTIAVPLLLVLSPGRGRLGHLVAGHVQVDRFLRPPTR